VWDGDCLETYFSNHHYLFVIYNHTTNKNQNPFIIPVSQTFKLRILAGRVFFLLILIFASSLPLHHFFLSIDIDSTPPTTRLLYNDLERQTQDSSLLLTILPIFSLTFAFVSLLPFFLVDRMGWHRIPAIWRQD
jgi:hypothetical protein